MTTDADASESSSSDVQENPHGVRPAPSSGTEAVGVLIEASPRDVAAPPLEPASGADDTAPVLLLENPHASAAPPSASEDNGQLIEQSPAILDIEGGVGVDHLPASAEVAPPRDNMLKARVAQPPPPMPRLRASFWFDDSAALWLELTLMSAGRELVHRVKPTPAQAAATFEAHRHLLELAGADAVRTGAIAIQSGPVPVSGVELDPREDVLLQEFEAADLGKILAARRKNAEADAAALAAAEAKVKEQEASQAAAAAAAASSPQPTEDELAPVTPRDGPPNQ